MNNVTNFPTPIEDIDQLIHELNHLDWPKLGPNPGYAIRQNTRIWTAVCKLEAFMLLNQYLDWGQGKTDVRPDLVGQYHLDKLEEFFNG